MSTLAPENQYVRVGQINTRYWSLGKEGSPVLLIHGIGGFVENWDQNAAALAERHRVFIPDLVGFGLSDKPNAPYTLPYFAQFISDFMAIKGISRATLVGWSLGGAVALQFARQFPGQLDKIVLVGSAGLGRELSIGFRLITVPFLGEWLVQPNRNRTTSFLKECVYDSALVSSEWVEQKHEMDILPNAQQSFLTTLRALGTLFGQRRSIYGPMIESLASISAPTLIIWGRQDRTVPFAHGRVAKEKLSNAQLHLVDQCGHFPPLECPEDFNNLLLDFLSQ